MECLTYSLDKIGLVGRPERNYECVMKLILQLNVPDFNNLYYYALSKFKIKEEFLYLSLNRRLNFLINYIDRFPHSFTTEKQLINAIIHCEDKTKMNDQTSKKIMALAYLRTV